MLTDLANYFTSNFYIIFSYKSLKCFKAIIISFFNVFLSKIFRVDKWINNKIKYLTEKRRKNKNLSNEGGMSEYKEYRNLVNREAKKAKMKWLNNRCKDIDFFLEKGLSIKAYKYIKLFFYINNKIQR